MYKSALHAISKFVSKERTYKQQKSKLRLNELEMHVEICRGGKTLKISCIHHRIGLNLYLLPQF